MKYKIGDMVKIRQWKDMKKEFGLDSFKNIKTKIVFLKSMKEYCGKILKIMDIKPSSYENLYHHRYYILKNLYGKEIQGIFSDDMFESNSKINIKKFNVTSDGKMVTVTDMNTGKNAIAKCHPEDKFDFKKGFEIAYDRLTGTLKKGDRVKVINTGCLCTTYPIFLYNNLGTHDFEQIKLYDFWNSCDIGIKGKVICIGEHESNKRNLAYIITNDNKGYIVEIKGLEKIYD